MSKDKNARDAMADGLLGGLIKKDEPAKVTRTYRSARQYDFDDDWRGGVYGGRKYRGHEGSPWNRPAPMFDDEALYGRGPTREQTSGASTKQTPGVHNRHGQYTQAAPEYKIERGKVVLTREQADDLLKRVHVAVGDALEEAGVYWMSQGALDMKAQLRALIEDGQLMFKYGGCLTAVTVETEEEEPPVIAIEGFDIPEDKLD